MAKIIKLNKTDDITKIIKMIKAMRETQAVFEADKGSAILGNSAGLRLMHKTAEVLGKKIQLKTDDDLGKILAVKAGLDLYGNETIDIPKAGRQPKRAAGSSPRFSDISGQGKRVAARAARAPLPRPSSQSDDDAEEAAKKPRINRSRVAVKVPLRRITPTRRPMPEFVMPRVVSPTVSNNNGQPKKSRFKLSFGGMWTKIFVLSAVVLIIAVFLLAVLLPQATVTVYARSEPITRDMEISVDKAATTVNSDKQVIPGQAVTRELSDTKTFQTTGTKEVGEKAKGTIRIYNFTKNTLTLKAATTSIVINGKKYSFVKDATGIRPTAKIGEGPEEEVDQSSLTPAVDIIADVAGDSYNLAANQKFQIINSALGQNQNVYAMNEAAVTGGSSKTLKILSQADVDRAITQMTDGLSELAEKELAGGADTTQRILPTGSNTEILAKTANKDVGVEAAEFDMTIIGRLNGLAYDENDVKKVMIDKISAVLSDDKYLLDDGKKDVTARFKSVDLAAGTGVLSVHFETVAAYKFNSGDLSKVLAGKNAQEIKEILLTKPEIDRVDVEFSPFFVNKAPKFNGKIYIKSQLSQI